MLPQAVKGAHTHTHTQVNTTTTTVACVQHKHKQTKTTTTTAKQANDQSADQTEIKTVTKRNSLRS